jgi:hypothetical protein
LAHCTQPAVFLQVQEAESGKKQHVRSANGPDMLRGHCAQVNAIPWTVINDNATAEKVTVAKKNAERELTVN